MTNTIKEKPIIFNLTRAVTISPVEFMAEKGYWEFTVSERNSAGKIHKVRFHSSNKKALEDKREMEIYRYNIVNSKVNCDEFIVDHEVKPSLFQLIYAKYKERVK